MGRMPRLRRAAAGRRAAFPVCTSPSRAHPLPDPLLGCPALRRPRRSAGHGDGSLGLGATRRATRRRSRGGRGGPADKEATREVVLRACQRRLTRADRLQAAAGRRSKLRHRALLSDLLSEVTAGVQSPLERRYLRDVDAPTAYLLRSGTRPSPTGEGRGDRRLYRDVRYLPYRLVVELDGRAAHPQDRRERDDLRDNSLVVADGTQTLRYGWRSVTTRAC